MKRIFEPRGYFTVPDGTDVSPFLNATDTMQTDVPWNALGDMSIASGRINPGVESWIHCHPVVTQVTYLVSGQLTVHMKDPQAPASYSLELSKGQAAVTEPGTFFQLQNKSDDIAEVLYLVSPAFVFEMDKEQVLYNDAILIAESWDKLESAEFEKEINTYEAKAGRAEAKRRLAERKGVGTSRLEEDKVRSLPEKYDYLAPDGSEIRLLVVGEQGGFAHRVLPAQKISVPIRHRTVEELWYVIEGEGEIWRGREDEKYCDEIRPGDSIRIPVGTSFQFRTGKRKDLKLLLATMPKWPGPQEAVVVQGKWPLPDTIG